FQAEDGIRDLIVTGVQTCALPISVERVWDRLPVPVRFVLLLGPIAFLPLLTNNLYVVRVGTETLIYMLLALGLNVAVGFAGLLEIGRASCRERVRTGRGAVVCNKR